LNKKNIYKNIGCIPITNEIEMEAFFDEKVSLKEGFYSVAINAEKIIRSDEDENFSKIVEESIFPIPDGIAALLMLKKKGFKAQKVDLPKFAIDYSAKKQLKLGLIGTTQENNTLACSNLIKSFPTLNLFGVHGYLNNNSIIEKIREEKPNIILLGMGSPKQELLAKRIHHEFKSLIIINCGGAIDILSGKVKRAPKVIQYLNAEWLYRMIIQPRRIKRYLKLFRFLPIYFKA